MMRISPGRAVAWGVVAAGSVLGLAGCSPSLDWRQVRPEGSGLQAMFPCKPYSHARQVLLAGQATRMEIHSCSGGGWTFGITFADIGDPGRVGPALEQLSQAAAANVGASASPQAPPQVQGMTPHPQARRILVQGRRPDGSALLQHAAFFSKGTRVYQASIVGAEPPPPEVLEGFFDGLALP
ncbi:hypothetical protein OOT46_14835 [Aquabacterium sp. A7-Y]|uniref:hypothetical protein n=1 Tax=Aquabacterium sp. A7-Y TaxID=1349605 RepID=UPI00223CCD27|nr:hypothetical protein [Aquabacterium sp. A7-Y]MCW7539117.1 hypothetical protein [Aquabacterium sp. A7-Y]